MSRLPLAYYGHPILRKKSEPVEEITEEIHQLVAGMIETIDKEKLIGLAAPQVYKLLRIFVCHDYIENPDGSWGVTDPQVYINPKLTNPSKEKVWDLEGCASIPVLRVNVERPLSITIEALNLDGSKKIETLEGISARIRMHENDHLNGVLTVDRTPKKERQKIEPALQKIKQRYNP